jgi:hypothetical protein
MSEQPVFWLGGKPGTAKGAGDAPEAQRFEPAVREACEAAGARWQNFVAALGGYGSWLAEIVHGGHRHRVIWNGKDKRLSLDRALPSGGWQELRACPVASEDAAGFLAGTAALLGKDAGNPS